MCVEGSQTLEEGKLYSLPPCAAHSNNWNGTYTHGSLQYILHITRDFNRVGLYFSCKC